jgi:hypothetical protein
VERILQKGAYSREALLAEVRKIVAACARKPARTDEHEDVDAAGEAHGTDTADAAAGAAGK